MRGIRAATLAATMLLTAACTQGEATSATVGPTTDATRVAAADPGDWPTYHRDNARTGASPDLAPPGTLAVAWHATLDGVTAISGA